MDSGSGGCIGKCAKTFIENLEERQDIRKGLERNNGAQMVEMILEKTKFSAWIGIGGSYDELCLFVTHQILHLFCYSEVTLIGRGQVPRPHVMRHDDWSQQFTLLQAIKSSVQHAYSHCCPHGETSNFDVIYKYQGREPADTLGIPTIIPTEMDALIINVVEGESHLTFGLYFDSNSNGNSSKGFVSINQLISTAKNLLDQIAQNPSQEVRQLQFCTRSHHLSATIQEGELDTIRAIYDPASHPSMADIFEEQALRVPSKIGLVVGNKRFTYAEINGRANIVRNAILATSSGLNSNDLIGLCLDRTELIIFAILGVWKAGGAYVPIDPNYPPARITRIFDDCQPKLILTDGRSSSKLPPVPCSVLDLSDEVELEKVTQETSQSSKRMCNVSGSDLALVIYTSGTTGKPKGVMIEQRSLVSQCGDYALRYPDLHEDEVVLQLFNYSFNAFMEPVTIAFSHGLCLLMVPFQLLLEPATLLEHCRVHGVTHIDGTPSLATQYNLAALRTLKRVAVGGEPLTHAHHSTFLTNNPSIRLYNIYGNSEGTLCTLTSDVTSGTSFEFRRPVRNKGVYLMSSGMKLVPPGAIGELCLTGAGVARGYLNNSNLTAQKFIPNPFRTESEIAEGLFPVLYRTGDLGVVGPSGGISIIGRKDLQVKIRGIRVEIAEIENGLLRFPGVTKAAVIWKEEATGNQLIGFLTTDGDVGSIIEGKVKAFLLEDYPEYMVPSRIYHLPTFPLTPNGKIDRNQLQSLIPSFSQKMAAEKAETAEVVAMFEIWEQVLSLPPNSVERTSNFFSLGGNSLLAIKVMSIVLEKFGFQLNPTKIMESGGSFESFLKQNNLDDSETTGIIVIPARDKNSAEAPLSTSQQRIWISRQNPINHIVFEFEIVRGIFEVDALLDRISNVVKAHEILRTVYQVGRFGMKTQKVLPEQTPISVVQKQKESRQEFITEPFDLSNQLPLRVGIFEFDAKIHRVLIVVHSIAMDAPAQRLFLEHLEKGTAIPSGVQYGDYALFQKNFIPGEEEKGKMAYWREYLNSQLPLPPRVSSLKELRCEILEVNMDPPLFNSLRDLAQSLETSLYSVFLSVQLIFQHLMEPTNQDVITGTFHFSRDHPHLYTSQGNFSHCVPLSIELHRAESVKDFISRVAGTVKNAKAMQSFPMDMTVAGVGGTRNLVKQECFKFLFHAGAFPQAGMEVTLDGAVLRLVAMEGDVPIFENTTEIYTQVDTSLGIVKLWRRKMEGWESTEEIKRLLLHIFNKFAEVGNGNVLVEDV